MRVSTFDAIDNKKGARKDNVQKLAVQPATAATAITTAATAATTTTTTTTSTTTTTNRSASLPASSTMSFYKSCNETKQDEPTNHLDGAAVASLCAGLREHGGAAARRGLLSSSAQVSRVGFGAVFFQCIRIYQVSVG